MRKALRTLWYWFLGPDWPGDVRGCYSLRQYHKRHGTRKVGT